VQVSARCARARLLAWAKQDSFSRTSSGQTKTMILHDIQSVFAEMKFSGKITLCASSHRE